jgi:rhodanese-related sulfurtransferase
MFVKLPLHEHYTKSKFGNQRDFIHLSSKEVTMKKILIALCLLGLMAVPAWAYDEAKAQQYEALFAPFADMGAPKSLARIPPDKLADLIKAGEEVILLDVRTPAERKVLSIGNPGTLSMQMNEVFKPENLAQIPTDKKVVVVCQKGLRSTLIGVALRDAGFKNVQSLKGGLVGLTGYLNCKAAHEPVQAK